MNPILRAAFDSEMYLANDLISIGELDAGFLHIERAHVLGQAFVGSHASSHWLMFKVEILRRRPIAALGQVVRIVVGSLGSAIGVVPVGNTGGSDISMFKRMPIEPGLQNIIEGRELESGLGYVIQMVFPFNEIPAKPYPSVEGIKVIMDTYDSPEMRKFKVTDLYDDSIMKEIDASGFVETLYKK